ncbi:hypothetical protein UFOVP233_60 [uncultured Caudovirales phage]|uniref:Uncharacterized protein n=1 Tax=uncultured Caudovirales phage TaxID=2100421 RepID=A0A6J7WW59_9CAUD|nr:hypothetical protein UFOVP233_60 [uncultured Caudovirales phage]
MAQHLTNMEITEISLVDEPANEDAKVVIVKSKSGPAADAGGSKKPVPMAKIAGAVIAAIEEMTPQIVEKAMAEGFSADPEVADAAAAIVKETVMDMEAVTKALEEAEAKLDALEKRATEAEASVKAMDDIIKAKDEEIAKAKKKPAKADAKDDGNDTEPDADEDDAEVMKSLPESIRKQLADGREAREQLAKAKADAEKAEAIEKAKALNVGDAEKVGGLLLRIKKGLTTPADADEIEGVLKTASKIAAQSPLFKSIGTSDASEGTPDEVLKAKAEEIQKKSDGKMTFAQAYDRALIENPGVYNEYLAKRR